MKLFFLASFFMGVHTISLSFAQDSQSAEPNSLVILSVAQDQTTVERYDILNIQFNLSQTYTNPFDPDIIDASFAFTGPSGNTRFIPAYWTGESPSWRIRIAPLEIGSHSGQIRARDHQGQFASHEITFTSISSINHGFIHKDSLNPFHLRFDNGSPYRPLGHNLCWPIAETIHSTYIDRMAAVGENWTRLWMQSFEQNIEWGSPTEPENAGLGRYSQIICRRWDSTLSHLQEADIHAQMCLDSFTAWNYDLFTSWNDNLYNSANGGPCSIPLDFLTNSEARRLNMQRYRYIIARWSAYTSVLCWELCNEIDALGSGGPGPYHANREIGAAWHQDMARYIHSIDPYHHPVTTSFAHASDQWPEVWGLPEIDLVQLHLYNAAIPLSHTQMIASARQYNKPVIMGEGNAFGTPPDNPFTVHIQIWAGAVAESGIMSWWWDWFHDLNLYTHFLPINNFLADEDWASYNLSPVQSTIISGPSIPIYGSGGKRAAFLYIPNYTGSPITDLRLRMNQIQTTYVDTEFWNTHNGTIISSRRFNAVNNAIEIDIPSFDVDIAIKIKGPQTPRATWQVW